MLKRIFTDTFHKAEEESARAIAQDRGLDRKVIVICLVVAGALTCNRYLGATDFAVQLLGGMGLDGLATDLEKWTTAHPAARLNRLAYWAIARNIFYFLVPWIVIRFVFRERLSDYGLKLDGALKDYRLYAGMLAVMLPPLWYFSGTNSFQQSYPFYQPSSGEPLWPRFWIWQVLYLSQFFTLEFFFRGFMTLGLRKRFGYYSVFVMMIPYCMIHFGKPMPETIGAILAGIVLGTLSLKSRSVLLGVLIHYSVAITMDLFALWKEGYFGVP